MRSNFNAESLEEIIQAMAYSFDCVFSIILRAKYDVGNSFSQISYES